MDVIDPLGGSWYIEQLTDQMEEKILAVMDTIAESGGMSRAVEKGLVQAMIGRSALAWQERVENGDQKIVALTVTQLMTTRQPPSPATERPDSKTMGRMSSHARFQTSARPGKKSGSLSNIARAANSKRR
ncbi:MAG: hypothetical protein CM1200mP41_03900 [Gammaproteobacteria bacterium]|nr:MAG: hypothetical protein CM1200mP41_03900 [Gammaproteobacteria bacterium]